MKNKYPIVDGNFIQTDMVEKWNDEKWQKEFFYLKEVRMNYLIMVTSITEGNITKTVYPSKLQQINVECSQNDIVDICLRNAEKYGIKVFLGINYSDAWWKKGAYNPIWLYTQMKRSNIIADELYSKYKSKYPNAFYGWYWVYEVDNMNFRTKLQFFMLSKAININLRYLTRRNERLPILLSPFMNSKFGNPKKYASNWAYLFKHTDFKNGDIFCPQDCVGGGGLKINEVDAWFSEFRKAVDTKTGLLFWGNVENFNQLNWSSAPLNRFVKQMNIVNAYVDNIITFSYSHYYSPNNIDSGFHRTYLHYVESGELEKEIPIAPQKIEVKRETENVFLIKWESAKDNIGICCYEVYCNKKLVHSTNVQRIYGGNKQDISMSFSHEYILKKGEKLTCEIIAIDFAGNRSRPGIVSLN